jgi:hypothetical protein
MSLAERVRVAPRFQRAIRIDTDLDDPHALEGFVCPQSAAEVLLNMGRHVAQTGHAAFTWTGPYGSGKSSLVVALNAVLNGDLRRRARAAEIVGKKSAAALWKLLPPQSKGWRMLPVVGRRGSPVETIGNALVAAGLRRKPRVPWSEQKLLEALSEVASEQPKSRGGLIVVVDEMGKFLEGAAAEGADIFFFQQVAELASRSHGRLLFIGILHQAFEEYAHRLSREQRDEWSKVQGRFIDLLVDTAQEEQLELLARAIQSNGLRRGPQEATAAVAECVSSARGVDASELASVLDRCRPLHPVVAALLGPMSRRRFGQNQRSVFGFLNSAEPHGFQEFLRNARDEDTYDAPRLWDYLRSNLEPSILASPDGHRWSSAVEVVERCETAQGERVHVDLLKAVALIDLFRERSGLSANGAVLEHCLASHSPGDVRSALAILGERSMVIFRKHLNAYAIYAGSDFDVDAALDRMLSSVPNIDFATLRSLASFQPVMAKRHYHETGALRWLDVELLPVSHLAQRVSQHRPTKEAMGSLLLPVPTENETYEAVCAVAKEGLGTADRDLLIGVSPHAAKVLEFAREATALERIREESPELAGDAVARREVIARLSAAQSQLENSLRTVLDTAVWMRHGRKDRPSSAASLSALASDIADEKYPSAPRLFNELLNRLNPSTNANAAKNLLLKAMVTKEGEERLGFVGFPAEAGLFMSLIETNGFYVKRGTKWRFVVPGTIGDDPARLAPVWAATDEMLRRERHRAVPLSEIFAMWRLPPFGIKDGVHEVLAVAYALSMRGRLAFYRSSVFQPGLTDLDADFLVNDARDVQLRWLELDDASRRLLAGIRSAVSEVCTDAREIDDSPLETARALVGAFDGLEPWTKRTLRLSPPTLEIRNVLRHATDPNTLLFDELPKLLGQGHAPQSRSDVAQAVTRVRMALSELKGRFAEMCGELRDLMLRELDVRTGADDKVLRARAENIREISGDFRLNAFIARLARWTGTVEDIEGIAGLAANKPAREWTDADLDQAKLEIASFAQQFIRTESFARVRNRKDKRHAMAVVVGLGERRSALSHEFAVSDDDIAAVNELVATVERAMAGGSSQRKNIILAALAEISSRYMTPDSKNILETKRAKA